MKKRMILIPCGIVLFFFSGCQKESKNNYGQALDMGISLQQKVLQKNSTNLLTISLENTSKHKLVVPESSFLLEFTSYSGSIKKTYYLDLSGDTPTISQSPQARLEIKGKGEVTHNINLNSILTGLNNNDLALPADDYAVNLILNIEPGDQHDRNDKIIRSNYLYVQVQG
jgi:hypothetical protein